VVFRVDPNLDAERGQGIALLFVGQVPQPASYMVALCLEIAEPLLSRLPVGAPGLNLFTISRKPLLLFTEGFQLAHDRRGGFKVGEER
jgi:hypothetical protein